VLCLLQEWHQAQGGSAEQREHAEKVFLQETSDDPLLHSYATSVLRCLQNEANQRAARGEDPTLTTLRVQRSEVDMDRNEPG